MAEFNGQIADIAITPQTMLVLMQAIFVNTDDIVANNKRIFTVLNAIKGKIKMGIVKPTPIVSQPAKGCNWTPIKGEGVEARELEVCPRHVQMEICPADWERICTDVSLVGEAETKYLKLLPEADKLVAMFVAHIAASMRNNMSFATWFGYGGGVPLNEAPFFTDYANSSLSDDQKALLQALLAQCDGVFAELTKYVAGGYIPLVDSNDGTAPLNAINPANVVAYFDRIFNAAPVELKIHPEGRIYVSPDIWNAYDQYLTLNLNNALAYQDLQDRRNDVANGIRMYRGKMIVRMDDWDIFDNFTGAFKTSTIGGNPIRHACNQRAIFTIPGNIALGMDKTDTMNSGYSLLVGVKPGVSGMGIREVFGAYSIGAAILNLNMVVASWNSSQTFI